MSEDDDARRGMLGNQARLFLSDCGGCTANVGLLKNGIF